MDSNGFKGEYVPGDVVCYLLQRGANISFIIDLKQEHSHWKEKSESLIAQLFLLETDRKWTLLLLR